MIRRRDADGYVLVSRAEQSHLAAMLAQHVGGSFAAPPSAGSLSSVLLLPGAAMVGVEQQWPLDAAGRPAAFDDLPLVSRIRIWGSVAEAGAKLGAFEEMLSSVMVLRHCAAASKQTRSMRDAFEVNRLQQREIERQARLRPQLGLRNDVPMFSGLPEDAVELNDAEERFDYDVRLALLLEQIAGHVCAMRSPMLLPAAPSRPGGARVNVSLRLRGEDNIVLQPFPLAETIECTVTGRVVADRIYDHEREFHHELDSASERCLRLSIRP